MRRSAHQLLQRHQRSQQHGFTLMEVLVALVVLSIGMLGMSRLTVSTVSVHRANDRLAKASALLQDSMERIKHTGYSYGGAVTNAVTNDYGSLSSYNTYGGTTFNYSLFKRVTSVAAQSPATNMKTVTVTIFWQNDQQALSASTIIAQ
jgi:prepilin-type N-terminal cleavage/methylation domain-containing protein